MNIILLQENLKQALNAVERIIGRNLTLPILNNILLKTEKGKLKISSTNLEIGINYWISCKVNEEGAITVPAKMMSGFINSLPNKKIELKLKDTQLNIKCENFKSAIKGLGADDFPIIPQIRNKPILKIKGNILKDAFSQVVEMTALSEARPEITGVYVDFKKDSVKIAGTDTFRLAEKNIKINNTGEAKENSVIIPQRTVQEVIRILNDKENTDLEVVLSESQILFDLGYAQIISRLIEGQYPDYKQIIPGSIETQVVISRAELINNIKIAGLFSSKINDIKIIVDPKKSQLEVFSKDADVGENKSQLEAEIKGKEVEAVLNYRYVLDGLNKIYSDKIIIGFNGGTKPILIRPIGDNSYNYVVMPIRA